MVDLKPFVRGAYGWVKVNDMNDWEMKMTEHGVIHHGTIIHDPVVADALEWRPPCRTPLRCLSVVRLPAAG